MKTLLTLIVIFSIVLTSCKQVNDKSMVVIRDCSGTYLLYHGKFYSVCNTSMVATFPDSAVVTASFKKITDCPPSPSGFCLVSHDIAEKIEVKEIR